MKLKPLVDTAALTAHFYIKADEMHCQWNDCHSNELSVNFGALADAAVVLAPFDSSCVDAEGVTECSLNNV